MQETWENTASLLVPCNPSPWPNSTLQQQSMCGTAVQTVQASWQRTTISFPPSLSFSCTKRRKHWQGWQTHNEYIKQISGPSCSPGLLFSISFWKMQESQPHSHYLNASTWTQTTPMLKMTLIQGYSWYPFNASLMPYKVPKTNANRPEALGGWDLVYWFLTLH